MESKDPTGDHIAVKRLTDFFDEGSRTFAYEVKLHDTEEYEKIKERCPTSVPSVCDNCLDLPISTDGVSETLYALFLTPV